MEISFKKDLKVSNLVISGLGSQTGNEFTLKMLTANKIPALLNTSRSSINGEICYLYDISSRHSFAKLYETEKLNGRVLYFFLVSLMRLVNSLNEYLLSADNVILLPECIFLNSARDEFYFCCCPAYTKDILEQLRALGTCFLSMLDYNDPDAVSLAFEFSRAVQAENFTVSDLSLILESSPGNIFSMLPQPGASCDLPSAPAPYRTALSQEKSMDQDMSATPEAYRTNIPPETKGSSSALSFRQKAKIYFDGKSFSEIYDDINSAKIIKKIKACKEPVILRKEDILPPEEAPADPEIFIKNIPDIHIHTEQLGPYSQNAAKLTGTGTMNGIYVSLDHFPFTIGKHANADFSPDSSAISRIHARICKDKENGSIYLEDMNSTNGTSLNGVPLEAYTPAALAPGDLLSFADCEFYFC